MTEGEAQYLVDRLERAIIEAQHKLANQADKEYVKKLKHQLVEMLVQS